MHRLRRMRCRLPEHLGATLRRRQGLPVGALAAGPTRAPSRARSMAAAAALDFGACSDVGACRDACPAGISMDVIASLNREVLRALWSRQ